jgi:hypothetical protein
MAKQRKVKPQQVIDHDQKIVEPNSYLELQKPHKDWYRKNSMGKQGNKPQMVAKEIKKAKGTAKHSLRKEK